MRMCSVPNETVRQADRSRRAGYRSDHVDRTRSHIDHYCAPSINNHPRPRRCARMAIDGFVPDGLFFTHIVFFYFVFHEIIKATRPLYCCNVRSFYSTLQLQCISSTMIGRRRTFCPDVEFAWFLFI